MRPSSRRAVMAELPYGSPLPAPFLRPGPWALHDPDLQRLPAELGARLLTLHAMSASEVQAQIRASASTMLGEIVNGVAVVPVRGLLMHRMDFFCWLMGGTSTHMVATTVRRHLDDPEVSAVVLDIDSPGGDVEGAQECFLSLFALRGAKRLMAVASPFAASAAYWIAAAADEIVVMPTGRVGSVGVYTLHVDASALYEAMGLQHTLIRYGDQKADDLDIGPLTDEARADLQAKVDFFGRMFEGAVAKGRGKPLRDVQRSFGGGRLLLAPEALEVGAVDRIGTLDETVAKLMKRRAIGQTRMSASVEAMRAGVVPSSISEERAPRGTSWSALTLSDFTDQSWGDLDAAERRRIARHFAWAAAMPPETFGDLKLGHHRASDGAIVFRGVSAALGRLDQTDIPSADVGKVRAHLEAHQRAFEEEGASDIEIIQAVMPSTDRVIVAQRPEESRPDVVVDVDFLWPRDDGMCHVTDEAAREAALAWADEQAILASLTE